MEASRSLLEVKSAAPAVVSNAVGQSLSQAKASNGASDVYTRQSTAKVTKHDRKRALSSQTVIDGETDGVPAEDAEPVRKKSKLKRIGNDGKPVRADDDAVTVTTNGTSGNRKERRRLKDGAAKQPLPEQPPADVDMDFFGETPKVREVIKKPPTAATTTTTVRPNGSEINLSKKRADGSTPGVTSVSGSRPQGGDARRNAAAAGAKPSARSSTADGLFIKKKKVRFSAELSVLNTRVLILFCSSA